MKFSNRYILAGKNRQELNTPVIARVSFKELQIKVQEITGIPVTCHSCGASIINNKFIKNEPPAGLHFICEFCNSLNKIDENQFNLLKEQKEHVIEYFEERQKKETVTDKLVACIDISSSMNGLPLEAVKQSLINTLTDFSINAPDSTFALITFASYVALYNAYDENTQGKAIVINNVINRFR